MTGSATSRTTVYNHALSCTSTSCIKSASGTFSTRVTTHAALQPGQEVMAYRNEKHGFLFRRLAGSCGVTAPAKAQPPPSSPQELDSATASMALSSQPAPVPSRFRRSPNLRSVAIRWLFAGLRLHPPICPPLCPPHSLRFACSDPFKFPFFYQCALQVGILASLSRGSCTSLTSTSISISRVGMMYCNWILLRTLSLINPGRSQSA